MSRPGRVTLGLFAKHWTPGLTKTRLAHGVGHERAAEVSRLLLSATLDRLTRFEAQRRLLFTPTTARESFAGLVAERAWGLLAQPEGSLGDRMRWFCELSLQDPNDVVVLVGSDSPDLPLGVVERAAERLSDRGGPRLLLGPTDDGGYWLLGARGAAPPVFDQLPWGEPTLLSATLDHLASCGWAEGADYGLIDPWYDVDTQDDLGSLMLRLSQVRGADPALDRLADRLSGLLGEVPSPIVPQNPSFRGDADRSD